MELPRVHSVEAEPRVDLILALVVGRGLVATVDIAQLNEALVLHFETEGRRINAYTFASTLIAIADAAKAANVSLNPGYEIEVVVEAVGPGSFRATIRGIYKSRAGVFTAQAAAAIVLGVLGNYIYERTFAVEDSVKIEINTNEVIIRRGDDRVVVPRNVYDATRLVEKNDAFPKAVSRALGAVASDENVSGLALVSRIDAPPPEIVIKRNLLQVASLQSIEAPNNRIIPEIVDLQILKAILERSKRKWEFMWRGVKISAPITDKQFYIDFFAHDITIAPGDILNVTLHVYQEKDSVTGIYRNSRYEVVQVHGHTPRVKQLKLGDASP